MISLFLCTVLFTSYSYANDPSGNGDPLDWLRDSIPGEPDVDYPILGSVQETSFTCDGRVFGGKIHSNITPNLHD